MSARHPKVIPDIDDRWIREHGLDAKVDEIIRTCGFGAVLASVTSAPARFRGRYEALRDPPRGPGAPLRRDRVYFEALFDLVQGIKRAGHLTDKAACDKAWRMLEELKRIFEQEPQRKDEPPMLERLGLAKLASLSGASALYDEYKRAKPFFKPPSCQTLKRRK